MSAPVNNKPDTHLLLDSLVTLARIAAFAERCGRMLDDITPTDWTSAPNVGREDCGALAAMQFGIAALAEQAARELEELERRMDRRGE